MGLPSTASQAARRALLDKKQKNEVERILHEIHKSGSRMERRAVRGEVFNTEWITIPGREISNVWMVTLEKDSVHYQSINRQWRCFYGAKRSDLNQCLNNAVFFRIVMY